MDLQTGSGPEYQCRVTCSKGVGREKGGGVRQTNRARGRREGGGGHGWREWGRNRTGDEVAVEEALVPEVPGDDAGQDETHEHVQPRVAPVLEPAGPMDGRGRAPGDHLKLCADCVGKYSAILPNKSDSNADRKIPPAL